MTFETVVTLLIGIVIGYGIRDVISRRRRAEERRQHHSKRSG
jgi:hypothetical protein